MNRIYIRDISSYEEYGGSEAKLKRIKECFYDLELLPDTNIRKEIYEYIIMRSKKVNAGTLLAELTYFNTLRKIIAWKYPQINSMMDYPIEDWERNYRAWMLKMGISLTGSKLTYDGRTSTFTAPMISYMRNIYKFTYNNLHEKEIEKDCWDLSKLGIEIKDNPTSSNKTVSFYDIHQNEIKIELKRAVFVKLQTEKVSTVQREITEMRKISRYLKEKFPDVQSCSQMNRKIMEEYLVYIRTEIEPHKDLGRQVQALRSIMELIGKLYDYRELNGLIINRDIPSRTATEFKTYSPSEIKRFNKVITQLDIQSSRIMIIHQLLGTRISDTLTLKTDCLRVEHGQYIIRIDQVKTISYEKPISTEVAMLIKAAIEYTKIHYGETKYIFVNPKNSEYPISYRSLQWKVKEMIYKENLRDDKGEYFGFGTHMFRHAYGVRLTEMHMDDWTIARLLGHRSISSVKHYRKMSNQMLADETRDARRRMSEIILANLDGWGEEYEQIRQDEHFK